MRETSLENLGEDDTVLLALRLRGYPAALRKTHRRGLEGAAAGADAEAMSQEVRVFQKQDRARESLPEGLQKGMQPANTLI